MPFLFSLFLSLACLPDGWPEPWHRLATPLRSAAATCLVMFALVAAAALVSRRVRMTLQRDPTARAALLRPYGRFRLLHLLGLFGLFGLSLYFLGWGWAAQRLSAAVVHGLGGPELERVPGAELLLLAPFLVAQVLSWVFFYDAERAFHDTLAMPGDLPYWARWDYVAFHVRQNLALVCLPVVLLILDKAVRRLTGDAPQEVQFVLSALRTLGVLAVFLTLPWWLRLVLGLKPLPDGALRQRLEAACQRLRFRCSNILVWNTHGGIANAMVAGVLPWLRYVLLTDRLAAELTTEEVEAVFGHEVGHVKHHHLLYYFGFLVSSVAMLWLFLLLLLPGLDAVFHLQAHQDLVAVPLMVMLGAYVFLVFGFVSRRCERQADIYGCRAVSCARPDCTGHDPGIPLPEGGQALCPTGVHTFIGALEKVVRLNGMSRDRPGWLQSWQHSTPALRIAFLERLLREPGLERRFQRSVLLVKGGLLLAVGCAIAVLLLVHRYTPQQSPVPYEVVARPAQRTR